MKIGTVKFQAFFATFVLAVALGPAAFNIFVGQSRPPSPSLPVPKEKIRDDGASIRQYSLKESKQRVKKAIDILRTTSVHFDTPGDFIDAENCAIELAQTGDPDAEYLIGWMYENMQCQYDHMWTPFDHSPRANDINKVGFMINCLFYDNFHNPAQESDSAVPWYILAAWHGSAAAAAKLGELYATGHMVAHDDARALSWYQKAVAEGDMEAGVELASLYEAGGLQADFKAAMVLYEQAAKSKDAVLSEDATHDVERLWLWKRTTPSANFCRGETDAFDYVCKYGSFWEVESLAKLYETQDGIPSDPERSSVLRKIFQSRYEAALHDPLMKPKVDAWQARKSLCCSIGKADSFR